MGRRGNDEAGLEHHPLDVEGLLADALVVVEKHESNAVDRLGERLDGKGNSIDGKARDGPNSIGSLRVAGADNDGNEDDHREPYGNGNDPIEGRAEEIEQQNAAFGSNGKGRCSTECVPEPDLLNDAGRKASDSRRFIQTP